MANTGHAAGMYRIPSITRRLNPGSVVVNWTTGGSSYSLTDNGDGTLSGDGAGTVSYASGELYLNPSPAPSAEDGDFSFEYERWQDTAVIENTIPINNEGTTNYAPNAPMKEGSVLITGKMVRKTLERRPYEQPASSETELVDFALTDDGSGNLRRRKDGPALGSVNYTTGEISFDARISYAYDVTDENWRDARFNERWGVHSETATEEYYMGNGGDLAIQWADASNPAESRVESRPIPPMELDLTPGTARPVIPGSVIFEMKGTEYRDQNGSIIKDWSPVTDAGINVGSIDYSTGLVTLDDHPPTIESNTTINIIACATNQTQAPANRTLFRTAGAPLREGSLIVNATDVEGNDLQINANTDGSLSGDGITEGFVDTQTGLVSITWSGESSENNPITPNSVRYSAVSYSYLPLDAELVGLDATRLPSDGQVPQFNTGDVVVVSHEATQEVATATAGQTIDLGRTNQAEVRIEGANGNRLAEAQYTLDTEAGTITLADPFSLVSEAGDAVTEPLTVYDRVEDMGLATEVQISGQISLNIPLSQDYPADETIVSAALLYGDLSARAYNSFHQESWDGNWSDERQGNETTAKYNLVAHPIEVTNQGAIKERWAIRFTGSTSFEAIGETVGVIATGNVAEDLAPTNPATEAPYFTIRKEGWGSGWVSGNTLRFNTDGGQAPFWVARTVVAGRAQEENDQFATQNRGDAD